MNENVSSMVSPAIFFENYKVPEHGLADPRDYPIDCLGPVLGGAALEIAEKVQIPEEVAGLCVLAAAALSVQKFAQVDIDGRTVALCLFILSILPSGERKSSADKLALKRINKIQAALKLDYDESKAEYEIRMAVYKARRDKIVRGKFEDDEKVLLLKELEAPTRPKRPELISSSPTLPSLVSILKHGVGSHGIYADEAGLMLGGHALNSSNELELISTLTKLYDGSSVNRMRLNEDECYVLDNCRLSLHLMAQPIVVEELWGNELWIEQGLLPRIILSSPESLAGTRFWREVSESTNGCLESFWDLNELFIKKLFSDKNGELVSLSLDSAAKKIWVDCYDIIEREQRIGGEFYNYKPQANRVPENMLRVAGILALYDNPEATVIKEVHMRRAGLLIFHHFSEGVRLFELRQFHVVQERAKILMAWFKKYRPGVEVAHADIQHGGPNPLRKIGKDALKEVLTYLESQGSIRRVNNSEILYRDKAVNLAWAVVV